MQKRIIHIIGFDASENARLGLVEVKAKAAVVQHGCGGEGQRRRGIDIMSSGRTGCLLTLP